MLIILGAFHLRSASGDEPAGGAVVVKAPERAAIPIEDTDGDGVADWKDGLEAQVFSAIATPTPLSAGEDATYTPPTTFTGKFSEAFFADYLDGKIKGEDFKDPSKLVGNAVSAINANTRSKTHSRSELTTTPTSPESVRAYGNALGDVLKAHSRNGDDEMTILEKALSTNDASLLDALGPIRDEYAGTIADALRMSVPDDLVAEHLAFLNAVEGLKTDVEAASVGLTDPLYTLARVRGHKDVQTALGTSFENIAKKLTAYGATYGADESGGFFYLFLKS
ncbi:MAG TPA: hypothetical protein VFS75_01645 [Candidatus Paceibacterota bacterium]|nr:hypothetical protein [Candidatus Paceibacterota bacterium]